MLLKCCNQYVSKFGKLSSGHRTGKGQFSFQSQRRAVPKNAQTTIQLHSFCMLKRLCSKFFKLGFSSTWTKNFQMYKQRICQWRRHRRWEFDSWVGKIPWRRKWQPTPVFLPGKFHGQRSLVDHSPWGHKESDMTEATEHKGTRDQIAFIGSWSK